MSIAVKPNRRCRTTETTRSVPALKERYDNRCTPRSPHSLSSRLQTAKRYIDTRTCPPLATLSARGIIATKRPTRCCAPSLFTRPARRVRVTLLPFRYSCRLTTIFCDTLQSHGQLIGDGGAGFQSVAITPHRMGGKAGGEADGGEWRVLIDEAA